MGFALPFGLKPLAGFLHDGASRGTRAGAAFCPLVGKQAFLTGPFDLLSAPVWGSFVALTIAKTTGFSRSLPFLGRLIVAVIH